MIKWKELSAQEQAELLNKLKQIKSVSIGLYFQLVEKLAQSLGIKSLPVVNEFSDYQGDLLNYIKQCKD